MGVEHQPVVFYLFVSFLFFGVIESFGNASMKKSDLMTIEYECVLNDA